MPRITPMDPPYPQDVQASYDVVLPPGAPPLNIFRTLAHNPRVLSRLVRGGLLDRGSISIAQRELVILRSCAVCAAEYEWGVHVAIYAAKAGFSQAQIADTCAAQPDPALWSEEQLVILRCVDELHASANLGDDSWDALRALFEPDQCLELLMLCGQYHTVSFIVNAARIAPEAFAPGFPDQGVSGV